MKVQMMKVPSVYQQAEPSRFHLRVAQSALCETPPYQPSALASTARSALSPVGTLSCNKQLLLAAASKDLSRVTTITLLSR